MFLRRKIKPEWQAITDAQARQISEARASQATAREDFLSSMQRLSLAEALDLLTAHYAGLVSPDELHDALNLKTREADMRRGMERLIESGPALARVAMGGESPPTHGTAGPRCIIRTVAGGNLHKEGKTDGTSRPSFRGHAEKHRRMDHASYVEQRKIKL